MYVRLQRRGGGEMGFNLFGKGKGKKKDQDDTPIPEVSAFPLKAYVYRLQPEKIGKIQVAGRIQGDFDGWTSAQDLEDMVGKLCGAGTYRCKVVKSGETKTHIGYHSFTLTGTTLVDGSPVDEKVERSRADANKVSKIEEEIEIEEAQARLDETKARRTAKQRQLGLLDDDGDDEETPAPQFGATGFEDPRVATLLASQKLLEQRLEQKDRESLAQRHEAEMKSMRDEMMRKIEMVTMQGKGDGGIGVMLSAQMEAIKAMMASNQQSTQAMMNSNSEMIKLIMSRDPSTGINERVDRLVEKLLDAKSSTGKEQLDIMKESFQTGILMAKGGEQAPTSMADVAREFSGRVLDIVGEFAHQKGQMTKEALAQEIQKATASVVNGLKAQLVPQALMRRALPPGAIPAGDAMPTPSEPSVNRDELRARVDKIMVAFLDDIEHGTENWKSVSRAQIPASELQRIGEFSFDNVAQYAMRHGSQALVRQVMDKLQSMGAVTSQQATMLLATYGIEASPAVAPSEPQNERASAPIEGDEDEGDDEGDEGDDALMGEGEALVPQVDVQDGAHENVGTTPVPAPTMRATVKRRPRKA